MGSSSTSSSSAHVFGRKRFGLRQRVLRRAVNTIEALEPRRLLANIVVNTAVDESIADNPTTSLREALQQFVDFTNATVTGTARVRLFKGRAMQIGAQSPHTLYDPQLASFSMEGYDVTAARGFIDLFGLPMKVASQRKRW